MNYFIFQVSHYIGFIENYMHCFKPYENTILRQSMIFTSRNKIYEHILETFVK